MMDIVRHIAARRPQWPKEAGIDSNQAQALVSMLHRNGLLAVVLFHEGGAADQHTRAGFDAIQQRMRDYGRWSAQDLSAAQLAKLPLEEYSAREQIALGAANWLVMVTDGRWDFGDLFGTEGKTVKQPASHNDFMNQCGDLARTRAGRSAAMGLPALVVRHGFALAVAFHNKGDKVLASLLVQQTFQLAGITKEDWFGRNQEPASFNAAFELRSSVALDMVAQQAAEAIATAVHAAQDWRDWNQLSDNGGNG